MAICMPEGIKFIGIIDLMRLYHDIARHNFHHPKKRNFATEPKSTKTETVAHHYTPNHVRHTMLSHEETILVIHYVTVVSLYGFIQFFIALAA